MLKVIKNNSSHDAFESLVRKKLENHHLAVDDNDWNAIEEQLHRKKKAAVWWYYGVGMAAAVILLLVVMRPFSDKEIVDITEPTQVVVAQNNAVTREDNPHDSFSAAAVAPRKTKPAATEPATSNTLQADIAAVAELSPTRSSDREQQDSVFAEASTGELPNTAMDSLPTAPTVAQTVSQTLEE
ncbi:MAG: hypothetical protein LBV39_02805, partial [Bacteroidales bacterium]|nr:hypothetical protein [Bacteroidales bacterium]